MGVGCVEFQDAFLSTAAAEGCVDPGLYLHETESMKPGGMCVFLLSEISTQSNIMWTIKSY